MLSVQNNFGSLVLFAPGAQPQVAVAFPQANTAGNGLIVAAYFISALPGGSPNLEISDSQNNTYENAGGCGISIWGVAGLLQAWYVKSCAGGPNTVTVTETVQAGNDTIFMAVSVFEYAGAFGALDASTFAKGSRLTKMSLSLMTTTADLLFAYTTDFADQPSISVDSNSPGWTQEQSESMEENTPSHPAVVALLAVDKAARAGPQSITFDLTQLGDGGVDLALLIAFPVTWTPPPLPPPLPPAPPAPGSPQGWPTIF